MYKFVNIVIPVYNEGENIRNILNEIESEVETPHNIFMIYDFDEDNTVPVARVLMRKHKNIYLLKNEYGEGALNAILTGFERIEEGVILIVMADLSDDIGKVDEMFKKINEGFDIVCGSRYMKGGKQIGGPKIKKILSKLAGVSLHYLIGIPTHDATNSFKMYTKRILDNIRIESNGGFELGMEIVIKAFFKGCKIAEIPSIWKERSAGASRFKLWKWLPKYMKWYLLAIKAKFWHY